MKKTFKRLFSLLLSLTFVFLFGANSFALVLTEYDVNMLIENESAEVQNIQPFTISSELYGPNDVMNGQFFIKSKASSGNSEYFLSELGLSSVGESFSNTDFQKWQFIDVGDGYYRIMGVGSKKYLAMSSGGYVELRSFRDDVSTNLNAEDRDNQLWLVTVTDMDDLENVSYKIQPKSYVDSGRDDCLGIDETLGLYGHDIISQSYYDDEDYTDEWQLFTYGQQFSIYYDQAFNARYSLYYPNSSNGSSRLLYDVLDVADKLYLNLLGVRLVYGKKVWYI